MSVQAMTHVIEHSKHKGSPLLLLIMIANHAHADGTGAFPSVATLARECRLSPRQVVRMIRVLEQSQELKVERSAGRSTHTYSVNMNTPNHDISGLNPDKMSGFNDDKMSGLRRRNPDKMSPPTMTSGVISAPPILIHEPSCEKSAKPNGSRPRRRSQKSDPLLEHPALKVFCDVQHCWPPSGAPREQIAARVGGDDNHLARWRLVNETWRLRGNKPTNVEGLLDWFEHRIPEPHRANGNGSQVKTSVTEPEGWQKELLEEMKADGKDTDGH